MRHLTGSRMNISSVPYCLINSPLFSPVCSQMFSGRSVLFGMHDMRTVNTVRSYTNTFHIPYVTSSMPVNVTGQNNGYMLYMRPLYTQAIIDIIKHYRWARIFYVFDSEDGKCYKRQQSTRFYLWINSLMPSEHICVGKLAIISSGNGLSPRRHQAIIWTSVGILIIGPFGTNVSDILIIIHTFSFKKFNLKLSFAKWRPLCPGLNMLNCLDNSYLMHRFFHHVSIVLPVF